MFHPRSLIRLFAALPGIGLALSGCVAYGPSADYPASPYGYYGDYGGYYGYYGGYAPGYAYPPGYAYAPGFFGSSLGFGFGQRFHGEHEDRHRDPDRFHRGNAPEHRGHGPTAHPPGPAHAAPAGRPPVLSGQTMPPHGATHGHGPAHGRSDSGDGRPRP